MASSTFAPSPTPSSVPSTPASTPSSQNVCLYMSSPLKHVSTPETLGRTIDSESSLSLGFWTAERSFLTPRTAKEVSNTQNRQVLGILSSKKRQKPSSSSAIPDPAIPLNFPSLKKIKEEEQESNKDALLKEILKELSMLKEDFRHHKEEIELYSPLGLTRQLAAVSLMGSLVKYIDNIFRSKVYVDLMWRQNWVGNGKPFSNRCNISYFRAWWFFFCENVYDEEVSLEEFWEQTISYKAPNEKKATKAAKAAQNLRFIGTEESTLCAHDLIYLMEDAESEFITTVTEGIDGHMLSPVKVRNAVGFFISVVRVNRNVNIHLFENLFGATNERRRYQQTGNVQDFGIDVGLCEAGILILQDLIANVEKIGDLTCCKEVFQCYAEFLLRLCSVAWLQKQKEEEGDNDDNLDDESQ